ncbi:hypothetical protein GGI12_005846, partial [Dipsacomyces acuminosporus]
RTSRWAPSIPLTTPKPSTDPTARSARSTTQPTSSRTTCRARRLADTRGSAQRRASGSLEQPSCLAASIRSTGASADARMAMPAHLAA